MNFPIEKTKIQGDEQRFDLNDTGDRKKYFELKAGNEIAKIKKFLGAQAFVAYLLGKKNSGKGTYSKLFMEAVGAGDTVGHLAVGDIVRDIHKNIETEEGKEAFVNFLKKNYRGFHSVEETIDLILGRSQASLISSELILALIKYEISKRPKQALFIDGFPRAHDQINYSMFLRELIGYMNEPDFFVFIRVPNAIIDERIKYRVVCPICKTPRNTKLLATKFVGFDKEQNKFYLMCDNPSCNKERMVSKEGDELGIEPIRKRLEVDDEIFNKLLGLNGVPKILLRNSVPVAMAKEYVDDYEMTPEYEYKLNADGSVTTLEKPWTVKDDEGVESYSLMPAAVVVSLLRQIVKALEL